MRQKVRWKEYIYIIIFLISCLNSYLSSFNYIANLFYSMWK